MINYADTKAKVLSTRIEGDTTTVEIVMEQTGEIFVGVAKCSKKDKFDANVGIKIATARAQASKCRSMKLDSFEREIQLLREIKIIQNQRKELDAEQKGRQKYLKDLLAKY